MNDDDKGQQSIADAEELVSQIAYKRESIREELPLSAVGVERGDRIELLLEAQTRALIGLHRLLDAGQFDTVGKADWFRTMGNIDSRLDQIARALDGTPQTQPR